MVSFQELRAIAPGVLILGVVVGLYVGVMTPLMHTGVVPHDYFAPMGGWQWLTYGQVGLAFVAGPILCGWAERAMRQGETGMVQCSAASVCVLTLLPLQLWPPYLWLLVALVSLFWLLILNATEERRDRFGRLRWVARVPLALALGAGMATHVVVGPFAIAVAMSLVGGAFSTNS
ncbi:MAG: hypothetical protein AAGG07_09415 [Planctomycetota bacterium]